MNKTVIIILLTGFISMISNAQWAPFSGPSGEINLFDGSTGAQGDWLNYTEWGVADLQADTDDNIVFELLPNTSAYADLPGNTDSEGIPIVWTNGADGNVWMEATTLFRNNPIPGDYTSATFSFTVNTNYLDSRYSVIAFLRIRETFDDWIILDADEVTITTNGTYTLNLPSLLTGTDLTLDAGFQMNGLNANPADDWGLVRLTINDLSVKSSDNTGPTPDPMLWTIEPYALSDSAISMTASNATDDLYDVEYLFTNLTANTSSGWQSSPTWVDAGQPTESTTNAVDVIIDPAFSDIDANWSAYAGAPQTPSFFVSTAAGVATVTPPDGIEWNLYQEYSAAGGNALVDAQEYEFSIDAGNITADGTPSFFIKSFNSGYGDFQGTIIPLAAGANSTTFTAVGGRIYQVGVLSSGTTGGSYDVSNPSLTTTNIVQGESGGLIAGSNYWYQVKARDTSANATETDWSIAKDATTLSEDSVPPEPNQMTFTATNASPISILLTADTASDPSGVEYYFTCTAGGGNDSGWQSEPVYMDTDLAPGSTYSYTVIARDLSAAQNSNMVSTAVNVMTMSAPESGPFNNTLTGFTGSTDNPADLLEVEKVGLTTGSINTNAIIEFDINGATFGDGLGNEARNLLKTIADGYEDVSFVAYATFEFSGQTDVSGYIGLGQGIQTGLPGNWGVPELQLGGVAGCFAEFKDVDVPEGGSPNCRIIKIFDGQEVTNTLSAPISATDTIRARFEYDAVSHTVSAAIDLAYTDDGSFTPDQDLFSLSTLMPDPNGDYSMFIDAPVRVYVGGGEGTIVKDFVIEATLPITPYDVQITDIASGTVLTWEGVNGRTYDVQYRTELAGGSWQDDPSDDVLDILSTGGTMSATSTVDSTAVFYRISAE